MTNISEKDKSDLKTKVEEFISAYEEYEDGIEGSPIHRGVQATGGLGAFIWKAFPGRGSVATEDALKNRSGGHANKYVAAADSFHNQDGTWKAQNGEVVTTDGKFKMKEMLVRSRKDFFKMKEAFRDCFVNAGSDLKTAEAMADKCITCEVVRGGGFYRVRWVHSIDTNNAIEIIDEAKFRTVNKFAFFSKNRTPKVVDVPNVGMKNIHRIPRGIAWGKGLSWAGGTAAGMEAVALVIDVLQQSKEAREYMFKGKMGVYQESGLATAAGYTNDDENAIMELLNKADLGLTDDQKNVLRSAVMSGILPKEQQAFRQKLMEIHQHLSPGDGVKTQTPPTKIKIKGKNIYGVLQENSQGKVSEDSAVESLISSKDRGMV